MLPVDTSGNRTVKQSASHFTLRISWRIPFLMPILVVRPRCASGMDKLELQDCLDHGRVAKVTLSSSPSFSGTGQESLSDFISMYTTVQKFGVI